MAIQAQLEILGLQEQWVILVTLDLRARKVSRGLQVCWDQQEQLEHREILELLVLMELLDLLVSLAHKELLEILDSLVCSTLFKYVLCL